MDDLFNKLSNCFSEIYSNEVYDIKKVSQIDFWKNNIEDFVKLYYQLDDNDSKVLFVKLVKLYLGFSLSHSKLDEYSLFEKKIWEELETKAQKDIQEAVTNDYLLDRIETYLLKGYEYKDVCKAENGDYVLDCGAYTGNTSIYFSSLVGQNGKVFCFEAMPQTYTKLCDNISDYNNIVPYNYAICDREKTLKFTQEASPGSTVCPDFTEDTIEVQGISIDTFVKKNKIKKIDFIKMDIEGSELNALVGCTETCKKFNPKLAVCIYHKAEDWINIPKKILELNKNYKFYIKHNSNMLHETVLFAVCSTKQKKNINIDQIEIKKILKLWKKFELIYYLKRILMYVAYYGFFTMVKKAPKKIFFFLQKKYREFKIQRKMESVKS